MLIYGMGKSMGKSPHTRYLIDGDGDGEIAPYAILNRWGNLWDGEIGSSRQVTLYAIVNTR